MINMYKYPKIVSFTLALSYLLICNLYLYNLYLAVEGVDIHNYLKHFQEDINEYRAIPIFYEHNTFFYDVVTFINIFFKFENASTIYIYIMSFITFFLAYKFFLDAMYLKTTLTGIFFIFLILFTPKVMDIFVSQIRGGLALVIFLYGMNFNSKIIKLTFIIFSSFIHFMVLPILSLYLLYYFFKKTNLLRKSNALTILILIFFCFIAVYIMTLIYPIGGYRNDLMYSLLIFFITIYFLSISKILITNVEGFVAIGLMIMILVSSIVDYHLIRFLGIAFVMYGLAIINLNNITFLKNNIIFYFVLFCTYHFYFLRIYVF